MEPQGIIQEEATINLHESLSSSVSSSSSSSSPSSSPSHTQSFASSPSSLKDLSAPSSASGSSSSSSSPFSEPSSPPPNVTTDHASTSSNTRARQHSDASVSVEEATNRADDASVHVEEAHHDTLRGQSMSNIYSVVVQQEEGSSSRSFGGNSGSELPENDKMKGMHIGSDEAEMCNRPATSNGSVECGFNVNSSACNGAANADSALDTHIDVVHTENALENHISMIDSESVSENHAIVVNTCDGPVSEQGKVEEGQEIVHKTNNQEHGSLNVESPTKREYIPIESAYPNGERSMIEGVFEREASTDTESQYISDIYKMGDSAEMNGTYLQGDNLKTCDPSSCTSEVKKRVCLFSSQPEEVLEGGSNFPDNTLMHHSPDKLFTEAVNMDADDASAIQGSVDVQEPNSAFLTEEPIIESLGQISPENHGLKRAQTMPTGNFDVVDGVVRSRKKEDLKRSITDKYIGGKNITGQSPGLKISRRKQKKLVKRICKIQKDGTVIIDADKGAELAPGLFSPSTSEDSSQEEGDEDRASPLPLQIAILIVGTRGDVQPFVAIGKRLQEYGHRVRLATHANFEEFVLQAGLEFYPLGGDPKVLAEYMVKNKGFLPSGPSEIRTQRKQLKSIINSLLPACTFPDKSNVPFKVQAIIANPPAYGHVHVAEYLNVPLHIFFTMPWTPTSEFPHPLSRSYHGSANRLSYQLVDSFIWLGIRGLINDFRKKKLKLRPINYLSGSQFSVSKLPTGYIWSPHLVPKPKDWGSKIDVVGFCFLDLLQDYQPPHDLVEWLKAGPPPIYVGFGSLPVEDAAGMTKIIVEALEKTYQRGIISRGWGGIGTSVKLPDSIYLLDNCPHDWLFSQCAAVVHHGGAGTTAAGLRAACPTTIVPFFGDQPFWGERVHTKGVGPPPIPVNEFSLDKLVYAINYMMDPKVKQNALELAEAMKGEDGVGGAVAAFHKHLPPILPSATRPNASKMPSNSLYAHLSCCF